MNTRLLFPLTSSCLLLVACAAPPAAASAPEATSAPAAAQDCPVTLPPDDPFVPPDPWPATPPGEDEYWYGDASLWTALPRDGRWAGLSLPMGDKFWWWSAAFDVNEDSTPGLTVTARPVVLAGGETPGEPVRASKATNGYHPSFHWAMLVGLKVPAGCWEVTGEYRGQGLTFTLWVGQDDDSLQE
jgi:hypothetical protein